MDGEHSPALASWNPALRPDTEDASNTIYTKNLSDTSADPVAELPQAADDEELPTTSIPSHVNAVSDKEPTSDDDFFDRYGTTEDVSASSIQASVSGINGGSTNMETTDVSTEPVRQPLENGAELLNGTSGLAHDQEHEEHSPEENYEHQGESTELEDAITEGDKVPLVSDPEPLTDEWGSSGEVFDLGGKPQDAPILATQAEAEILDPGDGIVPAAATEESPPPAIDWGNTDGDDLFAGKPHEPAQEFSSGQGVAEAADALWDLSLDDDFLPDNDSHEGAGPFVLDDDEGFLEDEPSFSELSKQAQAPSSSINKYAPQSAQAPKPAPNPYGISGPQFTDFSQMDKSKPIANPSAAYGSYNQTTAYQQQPQRPTMPNAAQSFADKAKGGYSSPYDLPDGIVTTRKRPSAQHHATAPATQITQPPPRSSSMYSNASAGAPPRPPPPSNMSQSSLSPPSSSHGTSHTAPKPSTLSKAPSTEFFAELPVSSKPKPPPTGRYTPQSSAPAPPPAHFAPPHFQQKERTSSWSSLRNEVLPDTNNLASQLQQPEPLPAFPELAPSRSNSLPVPQAAPAPPPAPSRYSPAPPPSIPSANGRYSPAPPAAAPGGSKYSPAPPQPGQAPVQNRNVSDPPVGPPRAPAQPFAPRTSSPLAFHSVPQGESAVVQEPSADGLAQSGPIPAGPPITARSDTPPLKSGPSSTVGSPMKRSNYTPQYQPSPPTNIGAPPLRSQSQSPGATMKQPVGSLSSADRPATSHGPSPLPQGFGTPGTVQDVATILPHKRQFSQEFDPIPPNDERAADPLARWKGYPVFTWGLGGTIVTSFPKQIPRYGGGSSVPMIKCTPGEVKIKSIKEAFPLSEEISKFPGPLKSKNKKKEVSAWLGQKIQSMEDQFKSFGFDQTLNPDALKRFEERILLWKVVQVLVDNDGHLEGNAVAEQAVRKILSSDNTESSDPSASFSTGADLVGLTRSNTSSVQADPIDPKAVDELRSLLTRGDREKAVWHAVDQRLWAHAMLLSSTLSKDIWKQVVQEFVRKEVKKIGGNNQALAVLYEIFAGNWEDCIDELVPASARAGFQMVSTGGNGASQNALQGLDRWRETLSLVLNNRSDGDVQALISLGRLLAGYGRVEAAHICFIFARSATHFGGVDDPQSDIVLLGADHRRGSLDIGRDLEPVLLTEVYEFALSLSAQGGSHTIPHLQNYKLVHAYTLAEYGQRTDAQSYCDAIAAAMKATTRISPYYNGSFISNLDDLSKRLSQSPKDGSSSWISKPSMDKVSGTLLAKFNSFIAGDEDDAASSHSGGADVGPFAKIAGNTPTISPSQSNVDLYGTYSGGYTPASSAPPTNSRYAPANTYAPRTSLDQGRSRYEPQGRPSMESADGSLGIKQASDSYLPSPSLSAPYTPSQYSPNPAQPTSKAYTYSPLKSEGSVPTSASFANPYQPTPPAEESAPSYGYQPPQASFDERPASPPSPPTQTSGAYEPPTMSYEPPTSSYEPPTYEPYNPGDEDDQKSPVARKKKSFMDDDDDDEFASKAAELKKKQRQEADRQADEAFRKAAEADAAKAKEAAQKKSGGWFGGWFKKDPNAAPGPIKAKLGEENSFFYDPDLGKWVNKKGGAAAATPSAPTPPPPRSGPPSRSASGNSASNPAAGQLGSSLPTSGFMGPPSRPPTSNPSPRSSSMPPPMSGPQSRASTPGIPSDGEGKLAPPLTKPNLPPGPPSRPGTGMSNASSIDDLLGAPQARKGGTVKGKKRGGRYVDVMAQK